jgi:hypothetical protein
VASDLRGEGVIPGFTDKANDITVLSVADARRQAADVRAGLQIVLTSLGDRNDGRAHIQNGSSPRLRVAISARVLISPIRDGRQPT